MILVEFTPQFNLVGGFNPSEKYESDMNQLGLLFPMHGEKGTVFQNVPNHQPAQYHSGVKQPLNSAVACHSRGSLAKTT